jgi:hypothetical protein
LVEKATGNMFVLVRDDVSVTGNLWVAPSGALTSMEPITPEKFQERFDWYVSPQNKALAEELAGGPVGPLVPFDQATDVPATGVPEPVQAKNKGGRPKGSKDTKPRKRPVRKPKVGPEGDAL